MTDDAIEHALRYLSNAGDAVVKAMEIINNNTPRRTVRLIGVISVEVNEKEQIAGVLMPDEGSAIAQLRRLQEAAGLLARATEAAPAMAPLVFKHAIKGTMQ